MAFEISEGPYSIESIMESIRVQVIDAESHPHGHHASPMEGNGAHSVEHASNPDAPRPLVNDGTPVSALLTQIELMRQRQSIQPDYVIHSHRRFFGGFANLLKKFIFWG